jgi:16S rRNA (cytosine1402-N4)-methyltransferase
MVYHKPVLLKESIDGLNIRQDGTYVDLTLAEAAIQGRFFHSLEGGRLIAFDQDADAEAEALKISDSSSCLSGVISGSFAIF